MVSMSRMSMTEVVAILDCHFDYSETGISFLITITRLLEGRSRPVHMGCNGYCEGGGGGQQRRVGQRQAQRIRRIKRAIGSTSYISLVQKVSTCTICRLNNDNDHDVCY